MTVTREGKFVRSTLEVVDETEIYTGSENRLTMNQTYTREFQCVYELQRYPFDSQVTLVTNSYCCTTLKECKIKMVVESLAMDIVKLRAGQVPQSNILI